MFNENFALKSVLSQITLLICKFQSGLKTTTCPPGTDGQTDGTRVKVICYLDYRLSIHSSFDCNVLTKAEDQYLISSRVIWQGSWTDSGCCLWLHLLGWAFRMQNWMSSLPVEEKFESWNESYRVYETFNLWIATRRIITSLDFVLEFYCHLFIIKVLTMDRDCTLRMINWCLSQIGF